VVVALPVAQPAAAAAAPAKSSTAASATPAPGAATPSAKPQPQQPSTPASKWATQLAELASMGFTNADVNTFLLDKHQGDLRRVINWLVENVARA